MIARNVGALPVILFRIREIRLHRNPISRLQANPAELQVISDRLHDWVI